jgi:polyisoprenoid-binding protein YceI
MKSKVTVIAFISIVILLMASFSAQAQRYMTRNGHISFFSEAPLENIEAHNRQVNAAFDASNGELVFRVLMKSFQFEKALMQEHFNENYVESDKFPNATFTGKISNLSEIDLTKNGTYDAIVEGDLTMRGITKPVKETGTFEVQGDDLTGKCVFNIQLKDYDITIPRAVASNISETIEIRVDVAMRKL